MIKTNQKDVAIARAKQDECWYGWSVFGGGWYTGTYEQLKKIGVLDPVKPE